MTDKTPDISAVLFTIQVELRPEGRAVRQTAASVTSTIHPELARECAAKIGNKIAELFEGEVEPNHTAH
jgi:hypothetical protein